MAKLDSIKWKIESDDQRIKFDLMTNYSDQDDVTSFGQVFFDGKKACNATIVLPVAFFKKQRKKRAGNKMLAYALAYHLSKRIIQTVESNNGNAKGQFSNKATDLAAELLGLENDSSIRKARNMHKIPSDAKVIVNSEPLGIIVLLDKRGIKISNGELIYNGRMWTWKQGDDEAIDGYGELKI
ncbi:hypothetical protein [Methylomonas fluvii]|uniref:Phage protein n=1 Tax=Methylomonas fluvii TaxID=1854564 RepID=A0ABR9D8P4_9GAMM|nr:hypothetical protein [Methylomonas fluvii]MBD9359476.1 hypothetical protein [Methylomonas fluvii]